MKKLLIAIGALFVLTGCEDREPEIDIDSTVSWVEDLQEKEAKEQERLEKDQEKAEKQAEWELENTDLIHYRVNRYSADGKFVVDGKYNLFPETGHKLEYHHLENRGWDEELDSEVLYALDASFFDGYPPTGKFDIYCVVWEKGSRDKPISVGVAYYSVSRGW